MLEKTASRRPFIDEIINMFPKPLYKLNNLQDINNYTEYKRQKPKEQQTKIERSLEIEFQILKNELRNPDPNKFLITRNNDINPLNKNITFICNQSEKGMKIIKKREPRWIVAGTYYSHISTERRTANIVKREQPNLSIRRIANQILDEEVEQNKSTRNVRGKLNIGEFVTNKVSLRLNESCNKIAREVKDRLTFINNY